jgi:hypothetical protein
MTLTPASNSRDKNLYHLRDKEHDTPPQGEGVVSFTQGNTYTLYSMMLFSPGQAKKLVNQSSYMIKILLHN